MSINSKSTKADILEAYEVLKKEKAAIEAENKKLNKEVKNAPITTTVASTNNPNPTEKQQETAFMNSALPKNISQTIENLDRLQVGFGSAVSNLSEQLINEAYKLEEIQGEIEVEIDELQEFHEIEEIDEDILDELIEEYQETAKTCTEEFAVHQENLSQQLQEAKQNWQKEIDNYTRELKETHETQQKADKRDSEEYNYNLKQERAIDTEEYEQRKKNLYKELEEVEEEQEKKWKEREENISKQEKEYAEAKQKVEEFEKKLEENIKNGEHNGKNIGNYQAKVRYDLRAKEVDGEKRNYELRIESLEQNIQERQIRINNLSQQLEAAMKQVQDLAVKAIEGSSNRQSLEAMKEIALEQAKNAPKNK
jgi:DNA repair exonuclease SbcCD ATPase subunit